MADPPPQLSPLSGAYLLIVVGEPFSEEHKQLILQKIRQGLNTWNSDENHVDLDHELDTITDCAPPGEEARGGERLIQFATENLVTEVLIHPQVNTLQQCIKNMLGSFTKHRHIIHAGYTFAGQGSWILQDGTFSFGDFVTAFEEYEVQRVVRSYENSISIHVNCCQQGEWSQESICRQPFAKLCQVSINPEQKLLESASVAQFINYLDPFLQAQSIQERLPPSDVVGNIRFSHPTLYVFPGGQGDSALFGINGFNMLIDGGFSKKACFWDFTRHLDRLDAILVTRLNDENTQGISAVLERKTAASVYPQIGHFFANLLVGSEKEKNKDNDVREKASAEEQDQLLVNVIHEGNAMIENLRILNLKPQICFRDNICDPINLYHKVGHGKLDMYVLNPSKDSREVKEFLSRWNEEEGHLGSFKSGINVDGRELWLPIANLVSICALLVWHPANPNDTITRLLFPGSTPQNKIFKGLEKLKKLECLKYPSCSANDLKVEKKRSVTDSLSKLKSEDSNKKDAKGMPQENTLQDRQEKVAKRKQEKIKRMKEDKEKQDKEKREEKERKEKEREEKEKIEKEKREKAKLEKLEKKKKEEREKKEKEKKDITGRKESEEKSRKEFVQSKEKEEKEKVNMAAESKTITEKSIKKKISSVTTVKKSVPRDNLAKATEKADIAEPVKRQPSSKPMTPRTVSSPSSKLKKDENNKKVMENRKLAAAKSTKKKNIEADEKPKQKKIVGGQPKSKQEGEKDKRTVDEKSVAEKVSEAIANGLIDNSRVVKDEDEDKESVIEKDQIEEMENSPNNDANKAFLMKEENDEEEPELQHIEDDDEQGDDAPVPDIGTKLEKEISGQKSIDLDLGDVAQENLVQEEKPIVKMAFNHVKTPDEVEDLPEHEVAAHEGELQFEEVDVEKCSMDENEKESSAFEKDKSDISIEAVRDNEIVMVAVEQKLQEETEEAPDKEADNENQENELKDGEEDEPNEAEKIEPHQTVQDEKEKTYMDDENEKDIDTKESDDINDEIKGTQKCEVFESALQENISDDDKADEGHEEPGAQETTQILQNDDTSVRNVSVKLVQSLSENDQEKIVQESSNHADIDNGPKENELNITVNAECEDPLAEEPDTDIENEAAGKEGIQEEEDDRRNNYQEECEPSKEIDTPDTLIDSSSLDNKKQNDIQCRLPSLTVDNQLGDKCKENDDLNICLEGTNTEARDTDEEQDVVSKDLKVEDVEDTQEPEKSQCEIVEEIGDIKDELLSNEEENHQEEISYMGDVNNELLAKSEVKHDEEIQGEISSKTLIEQEERSKDVEQIDSMEAILCEQIAEHDNIDITETEAPTNANEDVKEVIDSVCTSEIIYHEDKKVEEITEVEDAVFYHDDGIDAVSVYPKEATAAKSEEDKIVSKSDAVEIEITGELKLNVDEEIEKTAESNEPVITDFEQTIKEHEAKDVEDKEFYTSHTEEIEEQKDEGIEESQTETVDKKEIVIESQSGPDADIEISKLKENDQDNEVDMSVPSPDSFKDDEKTDKDLEKLTNTDANEASSELETSCERLTNDIQDDTAYKGKNEVDINKADTKTDDVVLSSKVAIDTQKHNICTEEVDDIDGSVNEEVTNKEENVSGTEKSETCIVEEIGEITEEKQTDSIGADSNALNSELVIFTEDPGAGNIEEDERIKELEDNNNEEIGENIQETISATEEADNKNLEVVQKSREEIDHEKVHCEGVEDLEKEVIEEIGEENEDVEFDVADREKVALDVKIAEEKYVISKEIANDEQLKKDADKNEKMEGESTDQSEIDQAEDLKEISEEMKEKSDESGTKPNETTPKSEGNKEADERIEEFEDNNIEEIGENSGGTIAVTKEADIQHLEAVPKSEEEIDPEKEHHEGVEDLEKDIIEEIGDINEEVEFEVSERKEMENDVVKIAEEKDVSSIEIANDEPLKKDIEKNERIEGESTDQSENNLAEDVKEVAAEMREEADESNAKPNETDRNSEEGNKEVEERVGEFEDNNNEEIGETSKETVAITEEEDINLLETVPKSEEEITTKKEGHEGVEDLEKDVIEEIGEVNEEVEFEVADGKELKIDFVKMAEEKDVRSKEIANDEPLKKDANKNEKMESESNHQSENDLAEDVRKAAAEMREAADESDAKPNETDSNSEVVNKEADERVEDSMRTIAVSEEEDIIPLDTVPKSEEEIDTKKEHHEGVEDLEKDIIEDIGEVNEEVNFDVADRKETEIDDVKIAEEKDVRLKEKPEDEPLKKDAEKTEKMEGNRTNQSENDLAEDAKEVAEEIEDMADESDAKPKETDPNSEEGNKEADKRVKEFEDNNNEEIGENSKGTITVTEEADIKPQETVLKSEKEIDHEKEHCEGVKDFKKDIIEEIGELNEEVEYDVTDRKETEINICKIAEVNDVRSKELADDEPLKKDYDNNKKIEGEKIDESETNVAEDLKEVAEKRREEADESDAKSKETDPNLEDVKSLNITEGKEIGAEELDHPTEEKRKSEAVENYVVEERKEINEQEEEVDNEIDPKPKNVILKIENVNNPEEQNTKDEEEDEAMKELIEKKIIKKDCQETGELEKEIIEDLGDENEEKGIKPNEADIKATETVERSEEGNISKKQGTTAKEIDESGKEQVEKEKQENDFVTKIQAADEEKYREPKKGEIKAKETSSDSKIVNISEELNAGAREVDNIDEELHAKEVKNEEEKCKETEDFKNNLVEEMSKTNKHKGEEPYIEDTKANAVDNSEVIKDAEELDGGGKELDETAGDLAEKEDVDQEEKDSEKAEELDNNLEKLREANEGKERGPHGDDLKSKGSVDKLKEINITEELYAATEETSETVEEQFNKEEYENEDKVSKGAVKLDKNEVKEADEKQDGEPTKGDTKANAAMFCSENPEEIGFVELNKSAEELLEKEDDSCENKRTETFETNSIEEIGEFSDEKVTPQKVEVSNSEMKEKDSTEEMVMDKVEEFDQEIYNKHINSSELDSKPTEADLNYDGTHNAKDQGIKVLENDVPEPIKDEVNYHEEKHQEGLQELENDNVEEVGEVNDSHFETKFDDSCKIFESNEDLATDVINKEEEEKEVALAAVLNGEDNQDVRSECQIPEETNEYLESVVEENGSITIKLDENNSMKTEEEKGNEIYDDGFAVSSEVKTHKVEGEKVISRDASPISVYEDNLPGTERKDEVFTESDTANSKDENLILSLEIQTSSYITNEAKEDQPCNEALNTTDITCIKKIDSNIVESEQEIALGTEVDLSEGNEISEISQQEIKGMLNNDLGNAAELTHVTKSNDSNKTTENKVNLAQQKFSDSEEQVISGFKVHIDEKQEKESEEIIGYGVEEIGDIKEENDNLLSEVDNYEETIEESLSKLHNNASKEEKIMSDESFSKAVVKENESEILKCTDITEMNAATDNLEEQIPHSKMDYSKDKQVLSHGTCNDEIAEEKADSMELKLEDLERDEGCIAVFQNQNTTEADKKDTKGEEAVSDKDIKDEESQEEYKNTWTADKNSSHSENCRKDMEAKDYADFRADTKDESQKKSEENCDFLVLDKEQDMIAKDDLKRDMQQKETSIPSSKISQDGADWDTLPILEEKKTLTATKDKNGLEGGVENESEDIFSLDVMDTKEKESFQSQKETMEDIGVVQEPEDDNFDDNNDPEFQDNNLNLDVQNAEDVTKVAIISKKQDITDQNAIEKEVQSGKEAYIVEAEKDCKETKRNDRHCLDDTPKTTVEDSCAFDEQQTQCVQFELKVEDTGKKLESKIQEQGEKDDNSFDKPCNESKIQEQGEKDDNSFDKPCNEIANEMDGVKEERSFGIEDNAKVLERNDAIGDETEEINEDNINRDTISRKEDLHSAKTNNEDDHVYMVKEDCVETGYNAAEECYASLSGKEYLTKNSLTLLEPSGEKEVEIIEEKLDNFDSSNFSKDVKDNCYKECQEKSEGSRECQDKTKIVPSEKSCISLEFDSTIPRTYDQTKSDESKLDSESKRPAKGDENDQILKEGGDIMRNTDEETIERIDLIPGKAIEDHSPQQEYSAQEEVESKLSASIDLTEKSMEADTLEFPTYAQMEQEQENLVKNVERLENTICLSEDKICIPEVIAKKEQHLASELSKNSDDRLNNVAPEEILLNKKSRGLENYAKGTESELGENYDEQKLKEAASAEVSINTENAGLENDQKEKELDKSQQILNIQVEEHIIAASEDSMDLLPEADDSMNKEEEMCGYSKVLNQKEQDDEAKVSGSGTIQTEKDDQSSLDSGKCFPCFDTKNGEKELLKDATGEEIPEEQILSSKFNTETEERCHNHMTSKDEKLLTEENAERLVDEGKDQKDSQVAIPADDKDLATREDNKDVQLQEEKEGSVIEKRLVLQEDDSSVGRKENADYESIKQVTEKRLSQENRSSSLASDISDKEIPASTPRSDITVSPGPADDNNVVGVSASRFLWEEKTEGLVTDTVDIMTQSIYVSSRDDDDDEPEGEENLEILASGDESDGIKNPLLQMTETVLFIAASTKQSDQKDLTQGKQNEKDNCDVDSTKDEAGKKADEPSVSVKSQGQIRSATDDSQLKDDPTADWGKPLGLPSPVRPSSPTKNKKNDEQEHLDTNKLKDNIEPVWMDLAYVPHHGCKNYTNVEFFKRIRARYYVFSGVEPCKDVFNALLEAKKTWENKDQEVTIIPTYDTDVLGYWVAENEDLLTELKIDLAPSASRCTINLQDHETSCAAYRLEF